MRHVLSAVVLVGALVSPAFAAGQAAPKPAQAKSSLAGKSKSAATHSTMGTVKSIDDKELVLTGKGKSEMRFALDSSTNKQGNIAVGSHVAVRYKNEGTSHVATAVTVHEGTKKSKSAKS